MSIQIDRSLFLPQIKNYAKRKGFSKWLTNANDLADETVSAMQDWFDWEPWKQGDGFDSQIDYRLKAKQYVKDKINIHDKNKSYFVPTFVWIWLAERVISYVIKLIIEHYWPDLIKGTDMDVL